MNSALKITAAVAGGLLVGGGAVQMLHAQSKPPAFVVAEITVKDLEGYEMNFLKPAQKTIADHGGKYLAGGFNKTQSIVGECDDDVFLCHGTARLNRGITIPAL
jgi:Domain of unknown function (DUF1330)